MSEEYHKKEGRSNLQNTVVAEIMRLHGEIIDAARTSLEKAQRVGELLTQEREKLKHGEWLPWVKANLPFTDRTARNYIRVHEERDRLKLESVSDLGEAYALLTAPQEYDLEAHEISGCVPMMTDAELDELTESIREIGLIKPITLYEGKILDGRCRYEACRRANVKPRFKTFPNGYPGYEGSAADFVWSSNLCRQHFNEGQRACIAAELMSLAKSEFLKAGEIMRQEGYTPKDGDSFDVHMQTAGALIDQARGQPLPDTLPELAALSCAAGDAGNAAAAINLRCERELGRLIPQFKETTEALRAIRDQRLYRGTHKTFEDYCQDKWGLPAEVVEVINWPCFA